MCDIADIADDLEVQTSQQWVILKLDSLDRARRTGVLCRCERLSFVLRVCVRA
jgi:hypothetical protein